MKISFVIPAHNEERNINHLLNELLKIFLKEQWDYEVVIVDDNSSDSTGSIADNFTKKYNNITVIHRMDGIKGIGLALKEGAKRAKGNIIIWVMADRCDDLSTIPKMIEAIEKDYDMIIASRYINGSFYKDEVNVKSRLSRIYSLISKLVFGLPVNDVTNAFRGFRKNIFECVKLESRDFCISPEFTIKAYRYGFRLGEIPTVYLGRRMEKSKFNLLTTGVRALSLFRYKFRHDDL